MTNIRTRAPAQMFSQYCGSVWFAPGGVSGGIWGSSHTFFSYSHELRVLVWAWLPSSYIRPLTIRSPDSSQFGTWNRTRRLHQPQFLARTDTNTSRMATAMAQHGENSAFVINMTPGSSTFGGGNDGNTATLSTMSSTTRNTSQPLFGPNIGFVSSGPSWAVTNEKKIIADDLTLDVVKGWIEKSKQVRVLTNLVRFDNQPTHHSGLSANHHSPSLGQPQTTHFTTITARPVWRPHLSRPRGRASRAATPRFRIRIWLRRT